MIIKDWDNHLQYLVRKFFESPLDDTTLKEYLFKKYQIDDTEEKEEKVKKIKTIFYLLHNNFFSPQETKVLSLYLGWLNGRWIKPRKISDIAKIMGISQAVTYNYFMNAVKKLRKYFSVENNREDYYDKRSRKGSI